MLKKKFTLITAGMLLMTAVSSLPVSAKNSYTAVQGGTVGFEKYLIYSEDANCPNVEFSFTIEAGDELPAASGKEAIIPGDDASVTGTPTMYSASDNTAANKAVFTSEKPSYDEPQTISATIGKHANLTVDPVTLGTGKVYSKDEVTVDFTGVTFAEPGVFRWKITETAASAPFVSDSNNIRYLDVYVDHKTFTAGATEGSGTGELEVIGYVLHSQANFQPSDSSTVVEPENGVKAVGFTNEYLSNNVKISNTVAGNQGSISKYFKYVVEIENGGENSKIDVTGAYDATVVRDTTDTATDSTFNGKENEDQIETDDNGDGSYEYYLQHGQYIVLNGLPQGATVTVTETKDDYVATYQIKEGSALGEIITGVEASVEEIDEDSEINFTNTKNGTIPTGIVTTVMPGVAMIICSAVFLAYVIGKRKENAQ